MNRTLVIGDIHGGLRGLRQILERAKVTPDDRLIFLGDYVDGWSESPHVLSFLIELATTHNCIFIRGNHDSLLLRWLNSSDELIDEGMWYKHGGEATLNAYASFTISEKQAHIGFLENLQNFYIDDDNRLFVHAGFTNINGVDFEYFPKMLCWERTLWETALSLNPALTKDDALYPKRLTLYNEIYIGHTPVTRIGSTVPVQKACVWNIDTGAAFLGPLTILDVATKEFWQSEPLYQLYATEKGRN